MYFRVPPLRWGGGQGEGPYATVIALSAGALSGKKYPLSPSDSSPWEGERKVLIAGVMPAEQSGGGASWWVFMSFPFPLGGRGGGLLCQPLLLVQALVFWSGGDPLRPFGPAPPERGSVVSGFQGCAGL